MMNSSTAQRRDAAAAIPATDLRDREVRRTADAFRHASRHSARVRRLKMILPALAAVFVVAFLVYSMFSRVPAVSIELESSGMEDGKLVMANPKLDGFTEDNLPYRMSAQRAIQDAGNTNVITLEKISATIPVDGKTTATIGANSGVFDNAANTLKIDSPLVVRTNDGMTAKLRSAFIEMKSGNLVTGEPVDITRNGSRIRADSMAIKDRGNILLFENRVRLTIQPDQLKTGAGLGQETRDAN